MFEIGFESSWFFESKLFGKIEFIRNDSDLIYFKKHSLKFILSQKKPIQSFIPQKNLHCDCCLCAEKWTRTKSCLCFAALCAFQRLCILGRSALCSHWCPTSLFSAIFRAACSAISFPTFRSKTQQAPAAIRLVFHCRFSIRARVTTVLVVAVAVVAVAVVVAAKCRLENSNLSVALAEGSENKNA